MEANSARFIPSTIQLIVGNKGYGNYEEGICGATDILPGMLIRENSSEELIPHDVRGGRHPSYVAIENAIIGLTKDDEYSEDDRVRYHKAKPGDILLMHLHAGENVSVGDWVMSYGDGTLCKMASSYLANIVAASSAVSNTVTETAFSNGTVTIPKNTLKVGDQIRVRAQGIATATNSTDTLTAKLKLGSTVLATTGAVDVADNDIFYIDFFLTVRTIGASGTFTGVGSVSIGAAGTVTRKAVFIASTAIDTTADGTLTVTATWSVASSSNSVRMDILTVERVSAGTAADNPPPTGEPVGRIKTDALDLSLETENDWVRVEMY